MGILRFFGGFALVGIGFLVAWKREWFLRNFGAVAWAESKLGSSGGTRTFYVLIGIGIIFIGLLMITGLFGGFFLGTIGRLFVPGQ